jgi:hypothetical protein
MAIAVTLLDEEITDAVAAVTPDAPTYSLPGLNYESLSLQANFTYGSGGTTAKAWVQTTSRTSRSRRLRGVGSTT